MINNNDKRPQTWMEQKPDDNRKAFNTQLNVNTRNSRINTAVVRGLQLFINLDKLPINLDNINCFHFNIN